MAYRLLGLVKQCSGSVDVGRLKDGWQIRQWCFSVVVEVHDIRHEFLINKSARGEQNTRVVSIEALNLLHCIREGRLQYTVLKCFCV
jgi:hypothetical protein